MLFKNCLSTFITCHFFHYLLFLTSSTTMHTFKLCLLIFFFFFLMFLLPSLGVESRCMASATIRMYSQSPCWVKSFNFLISSFQIMLISFSFLKSPSPKFRDNFQNNENLHESSETDFELNYNAVSITQSFKDTVMWNIPLCFLQQMWKEFQIAVSEWGLGSKKQLFVLTRNSISV